MARHEGGWIKLYRRCVEGDIGQNGHVLAVWVILLAWATRIATVIRWNGQPRTVPPGSVVAGIGEIAERLSFAKTTVHRALRYLVSRDSVRIESGTRGTLITICNWSDFYCDQTDSGTLAEHGRNTDGTRTEHERTLIGEVEKRRSIIAPNSREREIGAVGDLRGDPEVELFLTEVKQSAQLRWLKLYPDQPWVKSQLIRMIDWLEANPKKKPKGAPTRFIAGWLARGWEQHRKSLPSNKPAQINTKPITLEAL